MPTTIFPPDVTSENFEEYIYIRGDKDTEGSIRLSVDSYGDITQIEGLSDDVWNRTRFKIGPGTLHIGDSLAASSAGYHLMTEHPDGSLKQVFVHRELVGDETSEISVLHLYDKQTRAISQPDNSGEFTGKYFTYSLTSSKKIMIENVYFQTGSTAATSSVQVFVYNGTDNTGELIWDWSYPTSQFTADTETILTVEGFLEYSEDENIFVEFISDEDFSIKTNAAVTSPWRAADYWNILHDELLGTNEFVSGNTFSKSDWYIDHNTRKIYVCNTTGSQTGSFSTNTEKWNEMSPFTFSWEKLSSNQNLLIPENHQMAVNGTFTMEGNINLEGTIVLRN